MYLELPTILLVISIVFGYLSWTPYAKKKNPFKVIKVKDFLLQCFCHRGAFLRQTATVSRIGQKLCFARHFSFIMMLFFGRRECSLNLLSLLAEGFYRPCQVRESRSDK